MEITQSEYEDQIYYNFTNRGTEYNLRWHENQWELHSRRKALGKKNMGSFKWFSSLEELENKLKSLKGISQLMEERV